MTFRYFRQYSVSAWVVIFFESLKSEFFSDKKWEKTHQLLTMRYFFHSCREKEVRSNILACCWKKWQSCAFAGTTLRQLYQIHSGLIPKGLLYTHAHAQARIHAWSHAHTHALTQNLHVHAQVHSLSLLFLPLSHSHSSLSVLEMGSIVKDLQSLLITSDMVYSKKKAPMYKIAIFNTKIKCGEEKTVFK